jgi:hypothetical protein
MTVPGLFNEPGLSVVQKWGESAHKERDSSANTFIEDVSALAIKQVGNVCRRMSPGLNLDFRRYSSTSPACPLFRNGANPRIKRETAAQTCLVDLALQPSLRRLMRRMNLDNVSRYVQSRRRAKVVSDLSIAISRHCLPSVDGSSRNRMHRASHDGSTRCLNSYLLVPIEQHRSADFTRF